MAQSRYYSATAQPTVLTSGVTPSGTVIQVQQTVGFPSSTPYILALDYGSPSEEVVLVTAAAGTSLTVTRAYDGTSATSHNAGAAVRHTWTALDGNDSRSHEAATSSVHGVSTIVGTTETQTLTNKTLTNPVINGTVTGGASYTSVALTTPTISNPAITGTVTGSATYNTPTLSSPTLTGTATTTGATFTGGTYNAPTIKDETVTNSAIGVTPSTINSIAATTADLLKVQLNASDRFKVAANGQVSITPVNTATTAELINAATGFTGNLINAQVNSVTQFSVNQAGNVTNLGSLTTGTAGQFTVSNAGAVSGLNYKATSMASAYVESSTPGTASTSSATYNDSSVTVSTTCVVPPSGKVLIMGRCASFNGTASSSAWSTINVVGSVSGSLRASTDAKAIEVRLNANMGSSVIPAHESFVQTSANVGETLTIKWQHRVTAGTLSIDYRSISAVPLLG